MSEAIGRTTPAIEADLSTQEVLPEPILEAQPVRDAVDLIRQKGDVFDRLDWARRRPAGGLGGKASALYVGAMMGESALVGSGEVPLYGARTALATAYAGTAATVYKYGERQAQIRKAASIQAAHEAISTATGQSVELFRGKDQRVDLLWHAVDILPAQAVASSLGKIIEASKAAAIDAITVDYKLVKDFIPDQDADLHDSLASQDWWLAELKTGKGQPFVLDGTYGRRMVVSLTVDQAERVCEKALTHSQNEPLDSVMRLLRVVSPKHPALAYYRPEKGTQQHEKVLKAFRLTIERKLEDVSTVWREEEGVRYKQKTHLLGKPRVSGGAAKVDWRTSGSQLYQYSTDLYRELGVDHVGLAGLLRGHEHLPAAKLKRLCEIAGWSILSGAPIDISVEGDGAQADGNRVTPEAAHQTMPGIQSRASDILLSLRRKKAERASDLNIYELRCTRTLRSAKVLGAIYVASAFMGLAGNEYFQSTRTVPLPASQQTESDKTESVPVAGADEWFTARELMLWDSTQPAIAAIDRVKAFFDPKEEWSLADQPDASTKPGISDKANVGNIEARAENNVVWNVTSTGGLDTEGYWSAQVSSRLEAHEENGTLYYSPESANYYLSTPLPGSESVDPSLPSLAVRGVVDLTNSSSFLCNDYGQDGDDVQKLKCRKLPIPVLEGTKVVAAEISGRTTEIRVITSPSGQQTLLVPYAYEMSTKLVQTETFGESEQITYWLVPDEQAVVKKLDNSSLSHLSEFDLRAVLDGTYDFSNPYDKTEKAQAKTKAMMQLTASKYFEDRLQVDAAWEAELGVQLPENPIERLALQQQHIANTFEYELDPLADGYLYRSPETFVGDVLQRREANCNVANTALILSNPDQLMAVTGYHNENDLENLPPNESILSTSESHLWAVDAKGNIHDATPSSGLDEVEIQHFTEKYEEPSAQKMLEEARGDESKRRLAIIGAGVVISALIGGGAYRRLRGKQFAPRLKKRYIEQLDEVDIKRAYNAFQHYRWGGSEEPNLEATVRRSRQSMIDSLKQESPAKVRKSFNDREFRRALRRGNLIIKSMR